MSKRSARKAATTPAREAKSSPVVSADGLSGDGQVAVKNATKPTVTNQIIINAFVRAAGALGQNDPWALMARAGLSLTQLAADREGEYSGTAFDQLPNLSAAERTALLAALEQLTNAERPAPPAPVGGSLRFNQTLLVSAMPPDGTHAIPDPPGDNSASGRMMVRIWGQYGGLLSKVGEVLNVDPSLAAGVLAVESGGRAFSPTGSMIIRFETHVFYNLWGKNNAETFDRYFRFDATSPWRGETHQWRPGEDAEWRSVHAGQDGEWQAFSFARVYCNDEAAKLSISMGAPQIMGFNHARIGYTDVDAMYDAFENDERSQVLGFFDFVRTDSRLIEAMRTDDLVTFATYYNGVAVANTYANLMRDAVATLRNMLPQPDREQPGGGPVNPSPPVTPGPNPPGYIEPVGPHGDMIEPAPPMPRTQGPIPVPPAARSQPDQLPMPPVGEGALLRDVDPMLYNYWREHVREGFEQNSEMFNRILDAFMEPYYTTVWMYRVIFGVGVLSFVVAVALSIWTQSPWYGLVFGGLSAAAFISYFFNRPLQALEENLHFITWLGIIYNSYWTRLAYMFDQKTIQQDLQSATNDAIADLDKLLDKHATLSHKRPDANG